MNWTVEPLNDALGHRITGIDLRDPLSQKQTGELLEMLHDRCVLCFPAQTFSEGEQVAFGRQFGELQQRLGHYEINSHPCVMYITNEQKNGAYIGALPDGEMLFHSDTCYLKVPVMGSILYGMNVPDEGGDTLFANMYLAYDALSENIKHELDGLFAENCYDPGKSNYATTRSRSDYRSETELSQNQPVVLFHPKTGRKALYVNRVMTRAIVGMPDDQSADLLTRLFDHQEQTQFQYRHRWSPGDVIMWDNRCTLHARSYFSGDQLRKMRRVTVKGVPLY
jgi:taurine dioxygenase